jgi:hypothetical protein
MSISRIGSAVGREAIVPWHHLPACLPVRVLVAMDAGGQCSAVGWPLARRAEGGRETVAAGRQAGSGSGRSWGPAGGPN